MPERFFRNHDRYHSRTADTRFLRREVSNPRVEDLDKKWNQLKQWFDEEAITTSALFAALGYYDQYQRACQNIDQAQVKLGEPRSLCDPSNRAFIKESASIYQKGIILLEYLKKEIDVRKKDIFLIHSQKEFSKSSNEKRIYALKRIYGLWYMKSDKMESGQSEHQTFNQKIASYKNLFGEIQDLITQCKGGREVSEKLGDKLEELRQETVEQLGLLMLLTQANDARAELQSQLNEVDTFITDNKEGLLNVIDHHRYTDHPLHIEFQSIGLKLRDLHKEANARLLGKIDREGTAEGYLNITIEELNHMLSDKSQELENQRTAFAEQFENFQAWLEAEPRLQQAYERSDETWQEAGLSSILRHQPSHMNSSWRPILQALGGIESGLSQPEASRLMSSREIIKDILDGKASVQEAVKKMWKKENQLFKEELKKNPPKKISELTQRLRKRNQDKLSEALKEHNENDPQKAMVELTKYLTRINEDVENQLLEFQKRAEREV